MHDISSMEPFDTSMAKRPSVSVTTPFVVPLITILAPMIGSPAWSVTVPLTVFFYCSASGLGVAPVAVVALAERALPPRNTVVNAVAAKKDFAFSVVLELLSLIMT